MKHWPSQLFPLLLLGLLAGLSFVLMHAAEFSVTGGNGKFRHDPDAKAENFTVLRYDATGALKYRLEAPYMEHFPDDDSSEIRTPFLTHYRPEAPEMTIRSDAAKVTAKGTLAYLWGHVEAHRQATPERPEMIATMPDLTVNTEENTAFTNNPVEIRQGRSWVRGVGMNLDHNAATFVLHSQVTGQYFRPNVAP